MKADDLLFDDIVNEAASHLMKRGVDIPDSELDREYSTLLHAPLMLDMLREQVGVKINGPMLDICADDAVSENLVDRIKRSDIAHLLPSVPDTPYDRSRETAKAVLLAARFVADRASAALLTTKETDAMIKAMVIMFGQALTGMVHDNHPGDVQGTA